MQRSLAASLAGLLAAGTQAMREPFPMLDKRQDFPELPTFDWSTVEPSVHLNYTDCFDGYKCARLLAPMDWSQHNASGCGGGYGDAETVAIAIITLPATVPETDPSFGGTVMWNPGGPGGDATSFPSFSWHSPMFQSILDGERHYEILGFDPRSVGESTPSINCYEYPWQRDLVSRKRRESISPRNGRGAVADQYELFAGFGEVCAEPGPDSIHAHAGTASAARDMLHIVDKVDEERRWRTEMPREPGEGKPRLQFIGVSYGSALGNYFASMFPGRVGRMLLAGIMDSEDHRSGEGRSFFKEAEDAFDYYIEACFERSCPLRIETDTSPEDIKTRFLSVADGLDEMPITVIEDMQVHLIRSTIMREFAYFNSYFPEQDIYSNWMAEMIAGNWQGFYNQVKPEDFAEDRPDFPSTSGDRNLVISCLDSAGGGVKRDFEWAWERYQQLEAESPTFAQFRYPIAMECARWPLVPKYDFQEPFGSPAPDAELSPNAPAAPLFLLSTRADPTTPLANAWKTSRQHANSSVMVLEVTGHDQFTRASDCVLDAVRLYFEEGVVPANGTSCEPVPLNR